MFGKYSIKHPNNKYVLWDSAKAIYGSEDHNRNKPFRCNYKGYRLSIGMFHDFVTIEIINDLIKEMIK